MDTTIATRRLERRNSDPDLPADFDPTEHPILARHWFGVHPREVCALSWRFARQGHRLPPELNVILINGGRT